jgi:hypothetical protein
LRDFIINRYAHIQSISSIPFHSTF